MLRVAGDSAAGNGSAGGNGAAGGNGSAGVPGSRKRARVRPVAALPTQEAEAARTTSPAAAGTLAPPSLRAKGLSGPSGAAASPALTYSGPSEAGASETVGKPARTGAVTASKEPGRNAPCPCGSGKKYKMCHGRPGGAD